MNSDALKAEAERTCWVLNEVEILDVEGTINFPEALKILKRLMKQFQANFAAAIPLNKLRTHLFEIKHLLRLTQTVILRLTHLLRLIPEFETDS